MGNVDVKQEYDPSSSLVTDTLTIQSISTRRKNDDAFLLLSHCISSASDEMGALIIFEIRQFFSAVLTISANCSAEIL